MQVVIFEMYIHMYTRTYKVICIYIYICMPSCKLYKTTKTIKVVNYSSKKIKSRKLQ